VAWSFGTFEAALVATRQQFEEERGCDEVAIVWRESGEYGVLPGWIIRHFDKYLDWKRLRVVMFLTRVESEILWALIKEGIE